MTNEALSHNSRITLIRRAIFFLLVILLAVVTGSYYIRRTRLLTTFTKIQIGDSKQNVVQLLGNPTEVATCRDPNPPVDSQKCVETYWYYSFIERWGYAFNADGKVIDKIYNVSY